MKREYSTREKVAKMGRRVGIILSQETLIDAEWAIGRAVQRGTPFAVALNTWWAETVTAYPVDPTICEKCRQPFLNWDFRERKFCCDEHKRQAENARWYQLHREQRIRDIMRRRRRK